MDKLTIQEITDKCSTENKAAVINDGKLVCFIEEGNEWNDC